MPLVRTGIAFAAAGLLGVLSPAATLAASTTGNAWQLGYSAPGAAGLAWISCPSVLECVAVGAGVDGGTGMILRTHDGGATWSDGAVPSQVGALHDVSCATTTRCMALTSWEVGDEPYEATETVTSRDGGATWTVAGQTFGWLSGLTCVTTTRCTAVVDQGWQFFGDVAHTVDGGASWSFQSDGETTFVGALSCPTGGVCYFVAQDRTGAQVVKEVGGRFVIVTPRGSADAYSELSCPTAQACDVLGSSGASEQLLSTRDGGTSWTATPVPTGVGAGAALACPSVRYCSMVTSTPSPSGPLRDLTTLDGGVTWSTARLLSDSSGLGTISCPVIASCYVAGFRTTAPSATLSAVAGTVVHRLGARGSWRPSVTPGDEAPLFAVTCVTASTCVAVGQGTADRTSDGGATWTPATTPPTASVSLSAVACSTAMDCLASGLAGGGVVQPVLFGTTDGGATWATLPTPVLPQVGDGDVSTITALACPSSTRCLAVTDFASILLTTDGGSSWSVVESPASVDPQDHAFALDCPSAVDCLVTATIAGDTVVLTSTDGGSTWSEQDSSGPVVVNLSCSSATTCWGTSVNGILGQEDYTALEETTNGGVTWTQLSMTDAAPDKLGRIWCTATSCEMLVSGQLLSSADDGVTWTVDTLPSAMVDVDDVLPPTGPGAPWLAVGQNDRDGPIVATLP